MKITIDEKVLQTDRKMNLVLAAMQLGVEIPHYCYHPGLSVVGSCRMCLVEMGTPDRQTGQVKWVPKLIPACQTTISDGMVVNTRSQKVKDNQQAVMEYLLINHPLDCPVCDQAGECYLQDYSFRYGRPLSRFGEVKEKQPKKRVGRDVLLYADRCVMCSRCVRFTREVSGGGELAVMQRGNQTQIDIFPGRPLDDDLSVNVADICPVGALLDTEFLFKQRVWFLKSHDSICPGCATGCSIRVDHNDNQVWRLLPRENPAVNQFWMCNQGRHGFGYVHSEQRLTGPLIDRKGADWTQAIEQVRFRLEQIAAEHGPASIAGVLSPMVCNEENFMLATYLRSLAAEAPLFYGPLPVEGQDRTYKSGFIVRAEKAPNKNGTLKLLEHFKGDLGGVAKLIERIEAGGIKAVYLIGGYPSEWADATLIKALGRCDWVVVQDILKGKAAAAANVVLASAAFPETEGSYTNAQGYNQPFDWAIGPPGAAHKGGQILMDLAGRIGLYSAAKIRAQMEQAIGDLKLTDLPKPLYTIAPTLTQPTISARPKQTAMTSA